MEDKSFESIAAKMQRFEFNETFDCIVAIANGGIIPAALMNQKLLIDIHLLRINFRDPSQRPLHEHPRLLHPVDFPLKGKRILLVEDRVKTGQTLQLAKTILLQEGAAMVKTFAVNGNADYALFNENCFKFPWIIS